MNINPYIIAHRGFSGKYPENTILAINNSIGEADIVEFDVQITKDKYVVLFHDETTKRIFPEIREKRIQEIQYHELEKLNASNWFSSKIEKQIIPKLEDVIKKINNKILIIIELKNKGEKEEKVELATKVINILDDNKVSLKKGYLSVRDVEMLKIIHSLSSKYKIGLMQKKRKPEEFIELVEKNNIEFAQIRWKNWSESNWQDLLSLKTKVTAFYADEEEEYNFLIKKQVYGIFTNFPDRLRKKLCE